MIAIISKRSFCSILCIILVLTTTLTQALTLKGDNVVPGYDYNAEWREKNDHWADTMSATSDSFVGAPLPVVLCSHRGQLRLLTRRSDGKATKPCVDLLSKLASTDDQSSATTSRQNRPDTETLDDFHFTVDLGKENMLGLSAAAITISFRDEERLWKVEGSSVRCHGSTAEEGGVDLEMTVKGKRQTLWFNIDSHLIAQDLVFLQRIVENSGDEEPNLVFFSGVNFRHEKGLVFVRRYGTKPGVSESDEPVRKRWRGTLLRKEKGNLPDVVSTSSSYLTWSSDVNPLAVKHIFQEDIASVLEQVALRRQSLVKSLVTLEHALQLTHKVQLRDEGWFLMFGKDEIKDVVRLIEKLASGLNNKDLKNMMTNGTKTTTFGSIAGVKGLLTQMLNEVQPMALCDHPLDHPYKDKLDTALDCLGKVHNELVERYNSIELIQRTPELDTYCNKEKPLPVLCAADVRRSLTTDKWPKFDALIMAYKPLDSFSAIENARDCKTKLSNLLNDSYDDRMTADDALGVVNKLYSLTTTAQSLTNVLKRFVMVRDTDETNAISRESRLQELQVGDLCWDCTPRLILNVVTIIYSTLEERELGATDDLNRIKRIVLDHLGKIHQLATMSVFNDPRIPQLEKWLVECKGQLQYSMQHASLTKFECVLPYFGKVKDIILKEILKKVEAAVLQTIAAVGCLGAHELATVTSGIETLSEVTTDVVVASALVGQSAKRRNVNLTEWIAGEDGDDQASVSAAANEETPSLVGVFAAADKTLQLGEGSEGAVDPAVRLYQQINAIAMNLWLGSRQGMTNTNEVTAAAGQLRDETKPMGNDDEKVEEPDQAKCFGSLKTLLLAVTHDKEKGTIDSKTVEELSRHCHGDRYSDSVYGYAIVLVKEMAITAASVDIKKKELMKKFAEAAKNVETRNTVNKCLHQNLASVVDELFKPVFQTFSQRPNMTTKLVSKKDEMDRLQDWNNYKQSLTNLFTRAIGKVRGKVTSQMTKNVFGMVQHWVTNTEGKLCPQDMKQVRDFVNHKCSRIQIDGYCT
eukprot:GHVS01042606.1.p1 GENE.GHVS01042606.1~~GHVS01042606.1.p1  ORF type:complete len:1033 (-),score=99.19 GHVS01042606.1:1547-4645(-)